MRARICIIGNGLFANKVHYPSLHSIGEVDIVGICAFDEVKLQDTALRYNISTDRIFAAKGRSDYQRMLMHLKPDGVYVIGQPGVSLDIWIWCLQNKFNLFIEKPLGVTLHQARTLKYLAEKNECITQVSFQRRCSPLLREMRDQCTKRGSITHAIVEFDKYDISPMLGERDRMLDDYTHAVDTARWICGGEVIRIESQCKSISVPDINWIGATLHFDNGSTCFVIGNWTSGRRIFRVHMHAPGICVEMDIEREASVYAVGNYEGVHYDSAKIAGSDELYVYGGFLKKSQEFIESIIRNKELTSSPFRDAFKTMEVCETILAQCLIR